MADKALISDLTYRTLEMQRKAFPGMPIYVVPDDISSMLRPSRRKERDYIQVVSLAIIADNERDFLEFIKLADERNVVIRSLEEKSDYYPNGNLKDIILDWTQSRRNGAGKIGARISADKKRAKSSEGISKIKDLWPQPSRNWPTEKLLEMADVSLNTAKSHLGNRPIAQANYKAAQKRKERRNASA